MTRILTVDDSRAIRSIIAKQVAECGFEVEEAEDGEKGLAVLEEQTFDLILLDVTMPVMDGPEMLKRLRESGNKTPVIMLTAESKSSIVAGAMKLGIEDYIIKPFKVDELKKKLFKALKLNQDAGAISHAQVDAVDQPAERAPVRESVGTKQFVDMLVIDDMENVPKKLRTMLPEHITMNNCPGAQQAIALCREKVFRVVIIDMVIPDVNSIALMNQLRALQPHAAFLALFLRSSNDVEKEAHDHGFDGAFMKPFLAAPIEDFVVQYFDDQDVLAVEENICRPAAFTGRDDRMDRYFSRVRDAMKGAVEKVASACFSEAIVDVTGIPVRPDKTTRFILDIKEQTSNLGLELRLVGSVEVAKMLKGFTETAAIPFFNSMQEARSAA